MPSHDGTATTPGAPPQEASSRRTQAERRAHAERALLAAARLIAEYG
ncbi:hypothetical protein ACFV1W_24710 [Kitasatospora sp. NPDC059648]